jgi:ammonia channel protein AmtB
MMDTAIGGVTWYILGFAFAFGDETTDGKGGNPFIGTRYFAVSGLATSPSYDYRHWFFQVRSPHS